MVDIESQVGLRVILLSDRDRNSDELLAKAFASILAKRINSRDSGRFPDAEAPASISHVSMESR